MYGNKRKNNPNFGKKNPNAVKGTCCGDWKLINYKERKK